MLDIPDFYYYLAGTIYIGVLVYLLYFTRNMRKLTLCEVSDRYSHSLRHASWFSKLNLGAFVLTPVWLFANGFWLSSVVYMLLVIHLSPLAWIVSLVLLFFGSEYSWRGGDRWGNNIAAFEDMQFFFSTLSLVALPFVWFLF